MASSYLEPTRMHHRRQNNAIFGKNYPRLRGRDFSGAVGKDLEFGIPKLFASNALKKLEFLSTPPSLIRHWQPTSTNTNSEEGPTIAISTML